jgi:hypothetical protein
MKTLFILLLAFVVSAFPQNFKEVKIFINSATDLNIAAELSLDLEEAWHDKSGNIFLFVNDDEFLKLQQSGLGFEVLIDDWEAYYNYFPVLTEAEKTMIKMKSDMDFGVSGFDFGSMGGFYTFDEIVADLDEMFQLYPNLITEKDSIGLTHQGRTIWAVKISDNPNINEDEPTVGFDALVHAREPQSMATLMYFMWYLLENYGTDPEVTYLVDNREIYCVPCFNPDGYEYNRQTNPNGGGMWRKNRRNNGGSYGVDLNRNFGYKWGYDNSGSSPDPTSNTYRGPAAFSEPESQAIRDLTIMHNYGTHFNMHSWQDAILYPWGYINQQCPDSLTYREFASDMTFLNGYSYGTSGEILGYQSNGSVRDWMYGEQDDKNKVFGYTIEIGNSNDYFWPSVNRIFPIAQINVPVNMYQAFVAGEYVQLVNPNFSNEYFLAGDFVQLTPEYKNKGLKTAYNLHFELSSPSQYINTKTFFVTVDSIEARNSITLPLPLSFLITNSAPLEEEIPLVLMTRVNNEIMSLDTLKIIIGYPTYIFKDTDDDPDINWTITKTPSSSPQWDSTYKSFYSAPNSYTDSKNGNYSSSATVTMTLTNAINLSGYTNPRLTFQTKFDIENNWDYGQVQVSTNNGSTWIALEGQYTNPGEGSFQPPAEPVYDGTKSNWVKEEISLVNYISPQFKIRFRLRTDGGITKDGWYLDDIGVFIYSIPTGMLSDETDVHLFGLDQNYPNPFNPTTTIKFTISPARTKLYAGGDLRFTSLIVYDVLGNEVATLVNEEKPAGNYKVEFDGKNISSGIYFYKLQAGNFVEYKKMILMK